MPAAGWQKWQTDLPRRIMRNHVHLFFCMCGMNSNRFALARPKKTSKAKAEKNRTVQRRSTTLTLPSLVDWQSVAALNLAGWLSVGVRDKLPIFSWWNIPKLKPTATTGPELPAKWRTSCLSSLVSWLVAHRVELHPKTGFGLGIQAPIAPFACRLIRTVLLWLGFLEAWSRFHSDTCCSWCQHTQCRLRRELRSFPDGDVFPANIKGKRKQHETANSEDNDRQKGDAERLSFILATQSMSAKSLGCVPPWPESVLWNRHWSRCPGRPAPLHHRHLRTELGMKTWAASVRTWKPIRTHLFVFLSCILIFWGCLCPILLKSLNDIWLLWWPLKAVTKSQEMKASEALQGHRRFNSSKSGPNLTAPPAVFHSRAVEVHLTFFLAAWLSTWPTKQNQREGSHKKPWLFKL